MIIKGMVFWRHKSHLVKLSMCCHPRWPALQVIRAAIVSNINSSFLAKFRFPESEYTRRCKQHCWKQSHSQSYRSVRPSYLRPRDRGNYRENAASPITKENNSSHFHIPQIFCSLKLIASISRQHFVLYCSQPCSIIHFFFYTFSHLINF